MSATPSKEPSVPGTSSLREQRRVVMATIVGTTVEWYDFFIYAAAAGLVFADLFFKPAGTQFAQILSFITVGISFLFRPVGAFIAGHLGDRYGRRVVLMLTLVMMGVATTLVGVLPTHTTIGLAAPILLILLRILQGVSAGGEWGGAALLAVEHAPKHKRGLFGAGPQVGVPLGLLLASGVMALMAQIAPGEAFHTWGWRVPFLFSVVLIGVGYYIRRRVEESPVYEEIAERQHQAQMPIVQLFRKHSPLVLVAALVFAGNNAVGYMTTGGYIQRYATDPKGPLALETSPVLWAVTGSAVTWLISTAVAGWASDHLGRRTTYIVGWVLQLVGVLSLFPLVNTGNIGLLFLGLAILTIGLGFTYGPQASLYTELFPASIRFSGVSISYALGAILGGAFAPTIAQALVQATGGTSAVTWYLAGMTAVGLLATLILRDRSGIPLGPDHEAEQSEGYFQGQKPAYASAPAN
ncbi:MFS transporter [Intrasporangium chromatireducens Q5-1]|uniref:MFS transporter n=1 Tax=Intrasporangium chromatireducens Q5-1 TaxID=584657 RepID=W9GGS4_9MICO|nr:MFS transporter [Intrasporangium chromatireducens]EWT05446.1 MFS transporter [Intrasporangium chromatireducens Q5-1]